MLTTERQVRKAFWNAWRRGEFHPNVTPRRITNYSGNGKMHNADTRSAFACFLDSLSKDGQLKDGLIERVTL